MFQDKKPAEVFSLSVFLKDELTSRGWEIVDLSYHCTLSEDRLQEIVNGSTIYMREAEALGYAFGVSPMLFLTIQHTWLRDKGQ